MAWYIESQITWLKENAKKDEKGAWKCKKTGSDIGVTTVGRSIWEPGFSGGSGEVRQVKHITCLGCNPDAMPPEYGKPIYENQLVEL